MDNNVLTHHGIKGMRWGVRRTEKQLARARGENPDKKNAASTQAKAASTSSSTSTSAKGSSKKATDNDEEDRISTKALKDRNERLKLENEYKNMLMNDDDLQQRVNRLKLEKEYKQLTAKEKSTGRKLVEDVLTTSTKAVATAFVTKALTNLVNKVMTKGAAEGTSEAAKATADATKATADAFANVAKQFGKQAGESFRKTTTTTSSSSKTSFDSSDFDVSGEGTSRGSTKSKDNDFVDADSLFKDMSYNAGKSYFDTTFALPAPKDKD